MPRLEIEREVCKRYQISHSEFLGWLESDRDLAVWHYIRKWGDRPDRWSPDEEDEEV